MAAEHERVVLVVLERAFAQIRFLAFIFIGDEKREVFVEAQARRLDASLQHMFAAMMRDACEHARAPQGAIGVEVKRRVMFAAKERRRSRSMVPGDLRDRVAGPRTLPRRGLPRLEVALPLVLARFFLIFVVRNVEARSPKSSNNGERARRRGQPVNSAVAVRGVAVVVQVVRMHRIEEPVRTLTGEAERQRGRPAQRPAEHRRPLVRRIAAGDCLNIAEPRITLARRRPHFDDTAGLEAELGRHVARPSR